MTDAIKMLATDSTTDPKVKKKLVSVLGAWHTQFKDDPSMSLVANLYNVAKPSSPTVRHKPQPITRPDDDLYQIEAAGLGLGANSDYGYYDERRKREKEDAERKEEKRKAKEAKRKAQEEEEERRRKEKEKAKGKPKRKPFNYEQVRLAILSRLL